MDYSPFNPTVWGLFLAFAAVTWIAVRLFLRRHPDYPGKISDGPDQGLQKERG